MDLVVGLIGEGQVHVSVVRVIIEVSIQNN